MLLNLPVMQTGGGEGGVDDVVDMASTSSSSTGDEMGETGAAAVGTAQQSSAAVSS